jgi:hypothetical protein
MLGRNNTENKIFPQNKKEVNMGEFNWDMSHSRLHLGDKGDDWFDFNVPTGEVYLGSLISGARVEGAGWSFGETAMFGASGHQKISVHWWFDGTLIGGPGRVSYHLRTTTGVPGKIIVFEHRDFEGALVRIDLPTPRWLPLNDRISSLVVLKGNWTFYRDPEYQNPYIKNRKPITLPPGLYSWIEDVGIENDSISSMRCVLDPPNY